MLDRSDPETMAERAEIVWATRQFEERLRRVMKKHDIKPLEYEGGKHD